MPDSESGTTTAQACEPIPAESASPRRGAGPVAWGAFDESKEGIVINTTWWILLAILLPLLGGLATLCLPKGWIALRTLIAAGGCFLAFCILVWHRMAFGVVGIDPAGSGGVIALTGTPVPWLDSLHINLAFITDGLGLFFGLLVSGVGTLIMLYARGYFGPDPDELARFYPTNGFFATAMMGIVLSDYTLLTLVFWEMTSISSFLLIGWDRYDKHAVKLAMQAFFTTGMGGMALFGGVLLFGSYTGIWRWSELYEAASTGTVPWGDASVLGAFLLMFLGAATKSAQWPWHYWLPGAMAAPTPVSAFLHSATMVKAGVFLTGRLFPAFAGVLAGGSSGPGEAMTHGVEAAVHGAGEVAAHAAGSVASGLTGLELWAAIIVPFGAVTMLYGAIVAVMQHDLKRVFAYTTVSQLGLLMTMYGLGGLEYHHAPNIDWDISQIANHAFYKAPLFIAAGAIGHYLSRDLTELRGAFYRYPAICGTMLLAGYALAAGPGTISFQAKEVFLYAVYHGTEVHGSLWMVLGMTVLTAVCNVAIFVRLLTTLLDLPGGMGERDLEPPVGDAAYVHAHPHVDDADPDPAHHAHNEEHAHETGPWAQLIWLPGAILVAFQYLGGINPHLLWNPLFGPLETNIHYKAFENGLPALWELSPGVPLYASGLAIIGGVLLGLSPLMRRAMTDVHDRIYPAMYWLFVTGGGYAFRTVQDGHFRHYVTIVLVAFFVVFGGAVMSDPRMWEAIPRGWANFFEFTPGLWVGMIVCATAVALLMTNTRVVRVLLLGTCGFAVVGMYLIYQAPDLALTQAMVELISVILFVFVLRLLPQTTPRTSDAPLLRTVLAVGSGLIFAWMTLVAATVPASQRPAINPTTGEPTLMGQWYAQHSYAGSELSDGRSGGGDNIVNVILVDFRGFDTLGEIAVLGLAALGVWSLLPRRRSMGRPPLPPPPGLDPASGGDGATVSDRPRHTQGEGADSGHADAPRGIRQREGAAL